MNGPLDRLREAGVLGELDLRFADLMDRLAGGGASGLRLAAALASAVRKSGYVCLDVAGDPAEQIARAFGPEAAAAFEAPGGWERMLRRFPNIGKPGERAPLILDSGRLYLQRFWACQDRVARTVREQAGAAPGKIGTAVRRALDRAFPDAGQADQRRAAEAVVARRFAVVSGGPGTGKTYAVVRALVALCADVAAPRIALAAPTGKAAARLKESLDAAAAGLDPAAAGRLPAEAVTLHRLLGISPVTGRPRHDGDHPLPHGLVVVDEASMVDLEMMGHLLAALPGEARLALVGDRDQLASVEPGSVFGDLCGGLEDAGGAAAEAVTVLRKNFRFAEDGAIRGLAEAINAGDADAALDLVSDGSPEARLLPLPGPREIGAEIRRRGREGWAALWGAETDADALAAQGRFRILCSHRVGPYGAARLNAELERLTGGGRGRGTPLLVTANDTASGLFNGDTGVWWPAESGAQACFGGAGGPRRFSPGSLPGHETAFALTVHKSQGSEFDEVVLVLSDRDSPLLTRELVYTAVTRARRRVEIRAPREVLAAAIARRTDRTGGLREAVGGVET